MEDDEDVDADGAELDVELLFGPPGVTGLAVDFEPQPAAASATTAAPAAKRVFVVVRTRLPLHSHYVDIRQRSLSASQFTASAPTSQYICDQIRSIVFGMIAHRQHAVTGSGPFRGLPGGFPARTAIRACEPD